MVEERDIEKHVWTVSVREIAEHVYRRGDLREGTFGPEGRAGAEGHRALQQLRPDGYVAEMSFVQTVSGNGVSLQISGRADGVFTRTSPLMVEEIKTVTTPPLLIQGDNLVHWAQAEIYGALLAEKEGAAEIDIRLTYLDLNSGQTRMFTRRRSREALSAFFDETVAVYLAHVERLVFWRRTRDRLLCEMAFPFDAPRPGQMRLSEAVRQTARTGGRLFVEAPTGSGKTAALLLGALKAEGAKHLWQIVYLTAKTEGRRTVFDTVLRFRERGIPLKALVLSAKTDRCRFPDAMCRAEACPLAKGHFNRVRDAVDALFAAKDMDDSTVEAVADAHSICPYHLAREAAPLADLVICDYNFLFDPHAALAFLSDPRNDNRLVLVDEAHNLPDRAREMFSASLSTSQIEAVHTFASRGSKALHRAATALSSALSDLAATHLPTFQPSEVVAKLPDSFTEALDTFAAEQEAALGALKGAVADDSAFLESFFRTRAFVRALRRGVPGDIILVSRERNDAAVKIFARDPAPHIRRVLDAAKCAAVFFSGTLSPEDYFSRLLGGDETDPSIVEASVFPPANRLVIAVAHISTRYADRERSLPAVADAVRAAVLQKKGNYIVFFPSHAYLSKVALSLDLPLDRVEILTQSPNPTPGEHKKFIAKFQRKRPRKTLVGLAVLGGRFGESLDLPGDALIGAVIVSPGLPGISFEQELIRDHFDIQSDRGFEYAYAYPGMNKVRQAAGRVHRTETDRGILVFIGKRFLEPTYRKLLPWSDEEIQVCRSAQAVERAVSAFWKSSGVKPSPAK